MNDLELHGSAFVCDGFQEMDEEYVFRFLEEEEHTVSGISQPFAESYLPRLERQGVNMVVMSVGGDHVAQVMYSASEQRFWDAHKKLDLLNTEIEAGTESFLLCRDGKDIERARQSGKVAIVATMAGGRPLHGKANLNLLSSLRSLYRQGLRVLQLTGNGRNRLADGVAQSCTGGGLTGFGEQVAREARRLGMVIDTAQLSDHGFYDLLETIGGPLIDSHTAAAAICDHPRNISDRRIKAIAERGGVIGVSFRAALISAEEPRPGIEALLRHIDHIANLVGIDHLGLGPDYCSFPTPVERKRVRGFGLLGPDFCTMDRRTPAQSEKYPGWIDGVWYGIRESDYVAGLDETDDFPLITKMLLAHGYSETECRGILGENWYRLYRESLG